MTRAIGAFVVAAFSVALLISAAQAQQAGTDSAASTTLKADEKAYNGALKSLPNKPYDPWSGTR
jgi:hypothetical protein